MDTTPEATLRRLAPISGTLHAAMAAGIKDANKHFGGHGWGCDFEPWLYSHLVRTTAREYLKSAGLFAMDEGQEPAMSGLIVKTEMDLIRIRKDQYGQPPLPTSDSAKRFYEQYPLIDGLDEASNLLLLWNVFHGALQPMTLVRPIGSAERRREFMIEWRRVLPIDVTGGQVADLDYGDKPDADDRGENPDSGIADDSAS